MAERIDGEDKAGLVLFALIVIAAVVSIIGGGLNFPDNGHPSYPDDYTGVCSRSTPQNC